MSTSVCDAVHLPRCYWCGADAPWLVWRTGELSGETFCDPVCLAHLDGWLDAAQTVDPSVPRRKCGGSPC